MGGKTPHLEAEGQVELIIFQWNSFDSCTRQISASFGIFNIFINSKQVLKDRRLLLKSNEGICAFIKKTWQLMSNEQMISFHGYFLFLLIDHTDRSHVNETFHPISATPHRGFYFLNHGRFSQIPADCHFRLSPSTSVPSLVFHSFFTCYSSLQCIWLPKEGEGLLFFLLWRFCPCLKAEMLKTLQPK